MKKRIVMVGICCLATSLCGLLTVQKQGSASAEVSAPASVTDVENHFFMETGASVRKNTDSVGIRYNTTVNFYTDIDKNGNVDKNEAVTVEADEEISFSYEYAGLNENYSGRTNLYKFTGSITYTNLDAAEWSDEQRTIAYNMQLSGQAYAVITKSDGSTERVNAFSNDNVRSMAEVADMAIKQETSDGNFGKDEGNLTKAEEDKIAGYRKTESAKVYINAVDGAMNVGETYNGAKIVKVKADSSVVYNAENGTFTFKDIDSNITAAVVKNATLYTDKGIIETAFNVCTKVIKSADDWSAVFNVKDVTISGYYYLVNDITDYPIVNMKTNPGASGTPFTGTFDGDGHTVNVTLNSSVGLFGSLNAATIKNARFNVKMSANAGWQQMGIAAMVNGNCSFSDMYLKIENISAKCEYFGAFARYYLGQSDFNRVVVETPSVAEMKDTLAGDGNTYAELSNEQKETIDTKLKNFGAFSYAIQNINLKDGKTTVGQDYRLITDVYLISDLPLARVAGYGNLEKGTAVAWTIYAENKMPDTNGDGTITEADIDTENKITYWPTPRTANNPRSGKIRSFVSFDEMKASALDLTNYTNEYGQKYWKVDDGNLVWKGNA